MNEPEAFRMEAIVQPLLAWYDRNARVLPWRENRDPYRVWVSEIMLQQTRVETVKPYYERFLRRLPDVRSLAEAPEEELLKLWEGLGYYSRVKHMQEAARLICGSYGGSFPDTPEELQKLPGIGVYTAGAIASISFGKPVPAVDGNVLRVAARLTESSRDIAEAETKKLLTAALETVYPASRSGDFTQSLMELGALVCTPNGEPKCADCPLCSLCRANFHGTQALFPVKTGKKPRKIEQKTILLLYCGDRLAIRKRPSGGLLGALWELPNLEGTKSPGEIRAWLNTQGIAPEEIVKGKEKKHVFTHVEWLMSSYEIQCGECSGEFVWVTKQALHDEFALPTAFRKFLAAERKERA